MEALSDESAFSRQAREQDEGRYVGGSLILWIAAIAVLVGLNFASWSFCMWVFGQPEHPMNYQLLTRLEKLEPIQGFAPTTAPRGKFYSAKDLYALVYPFNETELRAYNGIQKRHYLKNYVERDDVIFLSGEFRTESVQKMQESDVFSSGLVIRGRSTTFPDAIIDLALPSLEVPVEFELKPGQVFRVEEASMCATLLHVERLPDATMVFTVVPLVTKRIVQDPETGTQVPQPMVHRFAENAAIAVTQQPTIRLEPQNWPISESAETIEARPGELTGEEPEDEEPPPPAPN